MTELTVLQISVHEEEKDTIFHHLREEIPEISTKRIKEITETSTKRH